MILRLLALIAYPPALLFHADTYAYLRAAVTLLPGVFRPSLYSIFLWLLIRVPGLWSVAVVQHLLGLAMGFAIYALLIRLGVSQGWAAVGAAPMLLDSYQINIEQYVLSETLFEALVLFAVVILLWRRDYLVSRCAASGLALGLAVLTRPVGLVVAVPLGLVVLKRAGWRKVSVTAAAFVLPLLLYATWFQHVYGVFGITDRDGYFLYARVAPFANCSGVALPSYERILCDPRPAAERPGPNYYLWWSESPIRELHPPPGVSREAALSDFSKRVIEHQPFTYAGVVLGDIAHYFSPGRWTTPRDERVAVYRFPLHRTDAGPIPPMLRQFNGRAEAARHLG
ncbi:MAG: hypothetical protein M3290_13630, partial [Actinomycetota bacterium]|nr:hypothetical protein [Actinomycetota bacterium]